MATSINSKLRGKFKKRNGGYIQMADGGDLSFNQMFAEARKSGVDTFFWKGKEYGTQTADEAIKQGKQQWVYKDKPNYAGQDATPYRGIAPGQPRYSTNEDYVEPQVVNQPQPNKPYSFTGDRTQDYYQNNIPSGGTFEKMQESKSPLGPPPLISQTDYLPQPPKIQKQVVYNNPKSASTAAKKESSYIPTTINKQVVLPEDVQEVVNENRKNKKFETFNGKMHVLSKENNNLYVFNNKHELLGSGPILRGATKGDFRNDANVDSDEPGNAATTPAGRYVINSITNDPETVKHYGGSIFNIKKLGKLYEESIALHSIYPEFKDFRQGVLDSPSAIDNLVTWGCINVPDKLLRSKETGTQVGDSLRITKEPFNKLITSAGKQKPWPSELPQERVGGYLPQLGDGDPLFTNAGNLGADENSSAFDYFSRGLENNNKLNGTGFNSQLAPTLNTGLAPMKMNTINPQAVNTNTSGGNFAAKAGQISGIVGMFQSLGKGASAMADPKDQYGVSTSDSKLGQQLGGIFDPMVGWKRNIQHAKEGKFEMGDVARFFGWGGADTNQENIEERDKILAKERLTNIGANRVNALTPQVGYTPVARQGGFIAYKGDTHDDKSGGILVDKLGNPVDITEGEAVASVEGKGKNKGVGEVSYYNPSTESTYVYSDKNGDAKPMRDIIKKYGVDKPLGQYKTDMLVQATVDKLAQNLQTAAEFAKETKIPFKNAEPMFRNGGTLSKFTAGSEHDISESEIQVLLKLGYKIKRI